MFAFFLNPFKDTYNFFSRNDGVEEDKSFKQFLQPQALQGTLFIKCCVIVLYMQNFRL